MMGLTASYGTMTNDDTDFMVVLDNIRLNGTIATVKPFVGYFFRDNRCVGVRFGYQHMKASWATWTSIWGRERHLDEPLGGMALSSDSYSAAFFYRSLRGTRPQGRFGLFAELEASMTTGSTDFINRSGETEKATYSDNFRVKLGFNPGLAVYIFPNVCATVSIGLGGIQYNTVTQRDAAGNKTGSRSSSKMRFRLNIADINCGMVVHFWDKKKEVAAPGPLLQGLRRMPADPFSCGSHVGTAVPGAALPVRGIRGSGRLRGPAVSWRGSAVCGVWRGRRGGAADRQAACVLGRGLSGRLGAVARSTQARYGEQGFRRWGEREANAALAAVFAPDGRKSATPGPCGPQFCSVRASAFGADVRRSLLCPAAAAPKRSAPETVHKGLRGAERKAQSVIFPPASGSGRASRRIRGSTPASSAA